MSVTKKTAKSLLDDDDDQNLGTTDLGIRVNKEYAARFEHNKRREELHRLQSKYPEEAEKLARKIAREAAKAAGEELPLPDDVDDDSSEDEEEDDGEIPSDTEAKIFDTLLRIRSQHPSIYQKDVHFFKEEDEQDNEREGQDGEGAGKGSKKAKALYLKDLIAKQALEYGPGEDSSDEEAGRQGRGPRHPKAYDTEQEKLRKAFLEAAGKAEEAGGAEEMGGVLHLRSKTDVPGADEDGGAAEDGARKKKGAKKGAKKGGDKDAEGQFQQLIEAYFGTEGELNPDDKFLKEYIVNKGWVDRDDDYVPSYREVVGEDDEGGAGQEGLDDDEDERYLREVDAFEAKYNFRFEEPGADRIVTHPRVVEGTVRKPDDKRKRQRDAKKQRLAEAEEAAREEVKRLKNLKKQEIENKLDKLRHVAGAAAPAAASLDDMLEGDFDPEEWDKKMAAAFDDKYYEVEEDLDHLADDLDLLGGNMEDSEGGGDDDDDDEEGNQLRFSKIRNKLREVDALSEEPEGEEGGGKKKGADPEAAARQRAELQRLLEEYYKLDYEDNVGGIKTRFRYKEVPSNTFGLTVDDILRLDDKALNQVVGIKRLAPYRDDLGKLRPNYKALEMVKGDMASIKGQRRAYKKRDWQKSRRDGGPGGKPWREEGGADEAAGLGPASVAARQATGVPSGPQPQAQRHDGQGKPEQGHEPSRKRKDRGADGSGKAGPGPGSEAAAGQHKKSKKPKVQGGEENGGGPPARQDGGKHERKDRKQALDPKQARLASYAVPTLKKEPGGAHSGKAADGKKRKRSDEKPGKPNGAAVEPSDGVQLTRAQRKNLKRSQKRASKRDAGKAAGTE